MTEYMTFRLGAGFRFAAQIPDDSVGCSGSRCTNCGAGVAYCNQVCRGCGLPLIGPWGFPQFPEWLMLTGPEKQAKVEDVYYHERNHGRHGCLNVKDFPLTPNEAKGLVTIVEHDEELFTATHGISPQKLIEKILLDDWCI